ncbi:putative F-box domain-containing protein [Medicago truncatula]|uniref:F-box protein interaction domain protein n=1 Tax=Medicago truncatula TaxID=3880 RepID=A0A072U6G2_MEDTR|nr:F-box/kelch-repeat protein At3g23880 [Medicago truncatula]KEH24738.1 F-box protein interaction domain protein [Medicago truncatula]RHN49667.1 putative F-box domain-containing protein [Medicago truncatula]
MSTVAPYRNIRKQNLSDPLGLFALLSLDLLLEILYRTPIKSLLTLNCVSKPFNSFISDPKFANDHLRLSKIHRRHHNLLISPWAFFSEGNFSLLDSRLTSVFNNNNSTTIVPDMKLNFPLNPSNIRAIIADSCDGIICLQTIDDRFDCGDPLLWNPCTTKFNILPSLDFEKSLQIAYTIGYDAQFTHTYKVVAVSSYISRGIQNDVYKTQVKVHTLGTNSWRRIPDFPSQLMGIPEGNVGKFVSGSVHWAIEDQNNRFLKSQDPDDHSSWSWHILSLHLGNESYREISQPDYGLPLHNFSLGVSRDCLCVLAHTETFLDIWRMNDYGNKDSWTKLFTLPFAEFVGLDGVCITRLYISEEDHQVFVYFINKVYVYNYKTGAVKNPKIQGLPCISFNSNIYLESSFNCDVYVESLISP